MAFYEILCPRGSRRFLSYDYFSVVSRRFYASVMYIMSLSPPIISELTHFHRLHQQCADKCLTLNPEEPKISFDFQPLTPASEQDDPALVMVTCEIYVNA